MLVYNRSIILFSLRVYLIHVYTSQIRVRGRCLSSLVIQVLQPRNAGSFKGTAGQEKLNTVRFTSHLCVVFALQVAPTSRRAK